MHQYSNTGGVPLGATLTELVARNPEDIEDLIVACSETVKAIAWRFARSSSRVDVDDFYSVGMLAVCEAAARAAVEAADHAIAYLCKTAKNAMIDEWRRLHERSTVSLDAPLSDESTLCLADLLVSPAPAVPAAPSKRVEALHGAMRRLSSKHRAILRRKYGLPGYGSHSGREAACSLKFSPSAVKMAAHAGRRKLAHDARLRKALGLEVM